MATKLTVSIIIPCYADVRGLKRTLEAIELQTWPANDREVLVVNNGKIGDLEIIKPDFPHCRWLHESEPGSYAARNRGLTVASGNIIAFTDADCVPDPTWLAEGIAKLNQSEATIIGGRVVYINPADRPLNIYERIEEQFFLLDKQQYLIEMLRVVATANLFTYRAVFDRVGAFNPSLKSFGDGDWTRRASSQGEKLAYASKAIIRHPRRTNMLEIRKKWLRVAGGRISQLQTKHSQISDYITAFMTDSWLDTRIHLAWFSTSDIQFWQRIKFAAALEFLSLSVTIEKIRVACGREPTRG